MDYLASLDKVAINIRSHKLLRLLLKENPVLGDILRTSASAEEASTALRKWVYPGLEKNPAAVKFYKEEDTSMDTYHSLRWEDYAIIRILDYIDHGGREFKDQNLRGEIAISNPVRMLWLAVNYGTGGARPGFFRDMLQLFRQLRGDQEKEIPGHEKIEKWMKRFPSGLDPRIVKLREENKSRIIRILIDKIDKGEINRPKYQFEQGLTPEQKVQRMNEWWNESTFHLQFAVRNPDLLNEMLDYSLDPDTMKILYEAEKKGIPFFVNPYYLSLLHVSVPAFTSSSDLAIRCYVLYSQQLVDEFGHIVAWEKEDIVKIGEPNAAGWILPSLYNVHRRYPEVAILIPDTQGRACGGLCASCQRMYDFQRGNLNFNLKKLRPNETWDDKLKRLLAYFENDSQLRDILITGGDALMSSNHALKKILDGVYDMALRKKEANKERSDGEKYAEIVRIRLGTRLPVYLPFRITDELVQVLKAFKHKASRIGIKQFVIQTHFESPMEVTPEAADGIAKLLSAGWAVTNQLVFTAAASRRGHTAKLRKVLNDVGVLTYYTFTVKGYMENSSNFAPNARAVQEQTEEKQLGEIPENELENIRNLTHDAPKMIDQINDIRHKEKIPFLATDRNVLNLPGVGKSLTFRVIGITRYGRRILEFDHDKTRSHSPIIHKMGKVVIIESKSISEYLDQLEEMGENRQDYTELYCYSIGQTEPRMPVYEYPEYEFDITREYTNLEV